MSNCSLTLTGTTKSPWCILITTLVLVDFLDKIIFNDL